MAYYRRVIFLYCKGKEGFGKGSKRKRFTSEHTEGTEKNIRNEE